MSLYTDRGAHYFRTAKAGEIDRGSPTQVGRALAQLGVEPIGAFSLQARPEASAPLFLFREWSALHLRSKFVG
jgi:hypothetical protein